MPAADPAHLGPLVYGSYLAANDVVMLSLLKAISQGWVPKVFMILPTFIYALQPWVFLTSLNYETLTVMNLLWDVMSDVLVTLSGLFLFHEKISHTKMIGVGLSLVSIFLLTWEGKDVV